jgi:hypothetical protein
MFEMDELMPDFAYKPDAFNSRPEPFRGRDSAEA